MNTKHAVLEDKGMNSRLVMVEESENVRSLHASYIPGTFRHVSELWEVCQQFGVTHVWVMADSMPDILAYDFFTPREGWNIFVPQADKEKRPDFPRGGRAWKEGGHGFQIYVFFPQREPWSWPVRTHLDVLATIEYLSKSIGGIDIEWSPQSIGIRLLKLQYSRTTRLKTLLAPSSIDLNSLPYPQADKDLQWRARLYPTMAGKYLHIYDKNAAHPCGAAMMVTGCGDPVHVEGHVDPQKPGLYRISWHSAKSIFDGSTLPWIFQTGQSWTTQPVLKFALMKGYRVQIHEAYIFEQRYRLFKDWVSELWLGRDILKNKELFPFEAGREIASMMIKTIMNSTIPAMRENWRGDMVGQSRVAILANIAGNVDNGAYPVLIFHDAIGYVSSDPSPVTAVPGILDRQRQLGGYKAVCTVPLTESLLKECEDVKAAGKLMKTLRNQPGLVAY